MVAEVKDVVNDGGMALGMFVDTWYVVLYA